MIEIAAGILLAVLILIFLPAIIRVSAWIAIVLVVLVASLALLVFVPGKLLAWIIGAMFVGGCTLVLLLRSERSSKSIAAPDPAASRNTSRDEVWLGDGQRIVTTAFGPFAKGQTIAHWQADYTRVFVGELAFSPQELLDNSRPVDRT